jgi:hypothetical protein
LIWGKTKVSNIQGPNLGNIGAVTGVQSPVAQKTGQVASRALAGVAGKMAGTISSALALTGEQEEPDYNQGGGDPYDIEDIVEELASELAGGPTERGALTRSLHAFVQEGAALFIARPESRSLAFIENVISSGQNNDQPADMASVADAIDGATVKIKAAIS